MTALSGKPKNKVNTRKSDLINVTAEEWAKDGALWNTTDEHHHRCCFSPGDYEVSIKFNDEHIPDSPFIVPIATLSDDARRLTITSLQVRTHQQPPSRPRPPYSVCLMVLICV